MIDDQRNHTYGVHSDDGGGVEVTWSSRKKAIKRQININYRFFPCQSFISPHLSYSLTGNHTLITGIWAPPQAYHLATGCLGSPTVPHTRESMNTNAIYLRRLYLRFDLFKLYGGLLRFNTIFIRQECVEVQCSRVQSDRLQVLAMIFSYWLDNDLYQVTGYLYSNGVKK